MTLQAINVGGPSLHSVLAGWLVGRGNNAPAAVVERYGVEAVVDACEDEGVVSLVYARLTEMEACHPVPPQLLQSLAIPARLYAARNLLWGSEARKIQQVLASACIPSLWLKGVALGQWLYPKSHLRDVADIDLLLPDHPAMLRAAAALAPLGYTLPNPHIAGDLVVHELLAWSERAKLELDLHWDLSNDALFANRLAWAELSAAAIPLPALGNGAAALGPVHALLHACIHRAVNHLSAREDRLRWLYDIHLLAERFDAVDWNRLRSLAEARGLATVCHDGLDSTLRLLGTRVPDSVMAQLRTAANKEPLKSARLRRWSGFQWATWRALPRRKRVRWLRQLLFPEMAHLRVRYGADGAGAARILARRIQDGWARWRGYASGR